MTELTFEAHNLGIPKATKKLKTCLESCTIGLSKNVHRLSVVEDDPRRYAHFCGDSVSSRPRGFEDFKPHKSHHHLTGYSHRKATYINEKLEHREVQKYPKNCSRFYHSKVI